ncbi:LysR substrate-binding domain-containing protein [Prosthecomicrobium pneumaticum]|uniref:DNA-binding transcriptional LysR family regulator n=1 Tax=Prosthecomicrobium pneumaticum TaxID=81895 RepID=A0A7W9CUE4_9HYPH|nr:LysR substrate-binding domain-containing protein [Prosthecomicrobium pneumaticum]MBB5751849.1 DNA-binding transcriptional LysR family regulator [Prosthecomicrobium pneumaticum]
MKVQDAPLDLRLMRLAHLLLTEGSVSRTALLTGQSQPAVSAALKRLRQITGDPLLVRSGARLVPTERGLEFRDGLGRILDEMDRLLDAAEAFAPAAQRGRLRILAANCYGTFLMPRIVELARRAAPDIEVHFGRMPEDGDILRPLEQGELDLVIGNGPVPPDSLRMAPLFDSEIVCMMRPAHPLARRTRLTMAEYLDLDHLSPTAIKGGALNPISGRLGQLGLHRRVAVTVPEYNAVPYVLARNDVVFTTGRAFAEHVAAQMPLALVGAPREFGPMRFYMLWHERAHQSGAGRWLRGLVRQAAADMNAEAPFPGGAARHPISAGV